MTIERIHLSKKAKDDLIKLKRKTGIVNWNILCRWAFCASLAEPATPSRIKVPTDSNVEMTWKVFGGSYADLYFALLKERCRLDGKDVSAATLAEQFRLHLHRGIRYLAADREIKDIAYLIKKGLDQGRTVSGC